MRKPKSLPTPPTNDAGLDLYLCQYRGVIERLLVTRVTAIHYDRESRVGELVMPTGCCCDMTGAIRLFERIDPDVEQIQTFSGDEHDVIYTKSEAGWFAGFLK
jgi:hypothetical protein